MKTDKSIEKYRSELNEIDKNIFLLCKKRIRIAKKVSEFKIKNKMNLLDFSRESQIKENFYKKVAHWVKQKKAHDFIQALFELNPHYPAKKKKKKGY